MPQGMSICFKYINLSAVSAGRNLILCIIWHMICHSFLLLECYVRILSWNILLFCKSLLTPKYYRGEILITIMTIFFGGPPHNAYGTFAPWPGIEPGALALEGEVLTTGLPGKSLLWLLVCMCPFSFKANFRTYLVNSIIKKTPVGHVFL